MKKLSNIILFVIMIISCFSTLIAQEDILRPYRAGESESKKWGPNEKPWYQPVMMGVELGLNYNSFSQNITWDPAVPKSPNNVFESGSGFSPFLGIMADFELSYDVGLQVKLLWDKKYFTNSYSGEADVVDNLTGIYLGRQGAVNVDYNASVDYFDLNFIVRVNVTKDVFLSLGPSFQFALGDIKQNIDLTTSDPGITFIATGTQNASASGNVVANARLGIEFGAGYEYEISKNLYVVPQLRYQLNIFKLAKDSNGLDNWKIYSAGLSNMGFSNAMLNSLQLSVALWFNL